MSTVTVTTPAPVPVAPAPKRGFLNRATGFFSKAVNTAVKAKGLYNTHKNTVTGLMGKVAGGRRRRRTMRKRSTRRRRA